MLSKLRILRKEQKISTNKMSEILGFKTASAYSKKESGNVPITLDEAIKISNFFGKSINEIFL